MKKLLLGSAAAVALSASGALAQEWSVTTGGFFTAGIGYVDTGDDDANEIGLIRDAEIIFTAKVVADNGITFMAQGQLETGETVDDDDECRASGGAVACRANQGEDTTNTFDEVFARVSGSFGRFEIGENDGAADAYMGSGIVNYTFASAQDGTGLIFDYYANAIGFDSSGNNSGDAIKVSYFTPNFAGFEAGVSFYPNLEPQSGRNTSIAESDEVNGFEAGAQYSGEFGGFGVTVGGGYASDTSRGQDDDDSYGVGAKVSFSGFEFGGNYGWTNGEMSDEEQEAFGLGVAYSTGPWATSIHYLQGVEGEGVEETFGLSGDVGYSLAPGVTVGVSLEYADPDDDDLDEEFGVGGWMALNF
jgi:hypothetical protein